MIRFNRKTSNVKTHAADKFVRLSQGKTGIDGLESLCHMVTVTVDEAEWEHHGEVTCERCRQAIQWRIERLQSFL